MGIIENRLVVTARRSALQRGLLKRLESWIVIVPLLNRFPVEFLVWRSRLTANEACSSSHRIKAETIRQASICPQSFLQGQMARFKRPRPDWRVPPAFRCGRLCGVFACYVRYPSN